MSVESREKELEKLNRLIGGIRVAMLTTLEPDGRLRSRPMESQPIDSQGCVWFFTSASSHKTDEVRGHPQVAVTYADPDAQRFVALSGIARLVRDRAKVVERWNPAYVAWFPEGRDDPDLALLRVEVERAEFWDTPSGMMVVLFEWARSLATGRGYEAEHHREIDLRGRQP